MARRKLPYQEGSWFAVPLRTAGYGVGFVARMSGGGIVFGYFFGPKRLKVPTVDELNGLFFTQAAWTGCFGDLGLIRGEWPIMARAPDWSRTAWPLPTFVRVDGADMKAIRVTYSDSDLSLIAEEPCDASLVRSSPPDALSGFGAVEIRLTRLLDHSDDA